MATVGAEYAGWGQETGAGLRGREKTTTRRGWTGSLLRGESRVGCNSGDG